MIRVRNLKPLPIGLANGTIPANAEGYAERYEVETLHQYLEVIQDEKEETKAGPDAVNAEPGQEGLLKKRRRPRNV